MKKNYNGFLNLIVDEKDKNPQTCLFSATLPPWVYTTAKKYMMDSYRKLDLVGREGVRTATTVQVGNFLFSIKSGG